jgi:hypothetical protein
MQLQFSKTSIQKAAYHDGKRWKNWQNIPVKFGLGNREHSENHYQPYYEQGVSLSALVERIEH